MELVGEVAQPLRFMARNVAAQQSTAHTVDFATMHPCFHQKSLLERVRKAFMEAWDWEEQEKREGGGVPKMVPTKMVRLTNGGWKWVNAEATEADILGA